MNTTFDLLHSVFGLNPNLSLTEGSANVQPSRLSQSVLNNKSELSFELTEIPDSIWEKVRLSVPDSYLRSFDSLRALFKLLLTEPSFSGSFSGLDGQLEVTSLEIHSLLTEVEPLPLDSEPPVIPLLSGLDSIDFIMNRDLTSSYEITSSCKLQPTVLQALSRFIELRPKDLPRDAAECLDRVDSFNQHFEYAANLLMVDFEFLQYKGEYFPFELSLYSGGYRDCIPIKGKCPDSVYRSQIGYTGQCHIPGAYKYGSEYKWPGLSLDSVLSLLSHLSNTFLFVFKDGAAERRILKGFDYHSVDLHPHLINVSMRKLRDATSVNYGIHSMHSGIGDMQFIYSLLTKGYALYDYSVDCLNSLRGANCPQDQWPRPTSNCSANFFLTTNFEGHVFCLSRGPCVPEVSPLPTDITWLGKNKKTFVPKKNQEEKKEETKDSSKHSKGKKHYDEGIDYNNGIDPAVRVHKKSTVQDLAQGFYNDFHLQPFDGSIGTPNCITHIDDDRSIYNPTGDGFCFYRCLAFLAWLNHTYVGLPCPFEVFKLFREAITYYHTLDTAGITAFTQEGPDKFVLYEEAEDGQTSNEFSSQQLEITMAQYDLKFVDIAKQLGFSSDPTVYECVQILNRFNLSNLVDDVISVSTGVGSTGHCVLVFRHKVFFKRAEETFTPPKQLCAQKALAALSKHNNPQTNRDENWWFLRTCEFRDFLAEADVPTTTNNQTWYEELYWLCTCFRVDCVIKIKYAATTPENQRLMKKEGNQLLSGKGGYLILEEHGSAGGHWRFSATDPDAAITSLPPTPSAPTQSDSGKGSYDYIVSPHLCEFFGLEPGKKTRGNSDYTLICERIKFLVDKVSSLVNYVGTRGKNLSIPCYYNYSIPTLTTGVLFSGQVDDFHNHGHYVAGCKTYSCLLLRPGVDYVLTNQDLCVFRERDRILAKFKGLLVDSFIYPEDIYDREPLLSINLAKGLDFSVFGTIRAPAVKQPIVTVDQALDDLLEQEQLSSFDPSILQDIQKWFDGKHKDWSVPHSVSDWAMSCWNYYSASVSNPGLCNPYWSKHFAYVYRQMEQVRLVASIDTGSVFSRVAAYLSRLVNQKIVQCYNYYQSHPLLQKLRSIRDRKPWEMNINTLPSPVTAPVREEEEESEHSASDGSDHDDSDQPPPPAPPSGGSAPSPHESPSSPGQDSPPAPEPPGDDPPLPPSPRGGSDSEDPFSHFPAVPALDRLAEQSDAASQSSSETIGSRHSSERSLSPPPVSRIPSDPSHSNRVSRQSISNRQSHSNRFSRQAFSSHFSSLMDIARERLGMIQPLPFSQRLREEHRPFATKFAIRNFDFSSETDLQFACRVSKKTIESVNLTNWPTCSICYNRFDGVNVIPTLYCYDLNDVSFSGQTQQVYVPTHPDEVCTNCISKIINSAIDSQFGLAEYEIKCPHCRDLIHTREKPCKQSAVALRSLNARIAEIPVKAEEVSTQRLGGWKIDASFFVSTCILLYPILHYVFALCNLQGAVSFVSTLVDNVYAFAHGDIHALDTVFAVLIVCFVFRQDLRSAIASRLAVFRAIAGLSVCCVTCVVSFIICHQLLWQPHFQNGICVTLRHLATHFNYVCELALGRLTRGWVRVVRTLRLGRLFFECSASAEVALLLLTLYCICYHPYVYPFFLLISFCLVGSYDYVSMVNAAIATILLRSPAIPRTLADRFLVTFEYQNWVLPISTLIRCIYGLYSDGLTSLGHAIIPTLFFQFVDHKLPPLLSHALIGAYCYGFGDFPTFVLWQCFQYLANTPLEEPAPIVALGRSFVRQDQPHFDQPLSCAPSDVLKQIHESTQLNWKGGRYRLDGVDLDQKTFMDRLYQKPFVPPSCTFSRKMNQPRVAYPGMPDTSPINVMWALFTRQVSPLSLPRMDTQLSLDYHKIVNRIIPLIQQQSKIRFRDLDVLKDYVDKHVEGPKKGTYRSAWLRIRDFPRFRSTYSMFGKAAETQYKPISKVKQRLIMNPSDEMKVCVGAVMHELQECVKQVPLLRGYTQGIDSKELVDSIEEQVRGIPSPEVLKLDHERHDAHMSYELRQHVMIPIYSACVPEICRMYGYRRDLIDSILHVLTRPSNKVVFKLPKSMANLRVAPSKIPTILQGNIRGTVFSGYPGTTVENTTTTLVNSLVAVKRAWGFGMFRQIRPNTKVAFFHAGDDLMALGNIRDLEKYQLALSTVIGFNDSTHNNGQRARDVDMGGTNMDFLSKKGLFLREQSFLYPLISRVCWRGAINHNADLSDSELNYCNVKDLESWSSTLPGFRNVLHELSTQPQSVNGRTFVNKYSIGNSKFTSDPDLLKLSQPEIPLVDDGFPILRVGRLRLQEVISQVDASRMSTSTSNRLITSEGIPKSLCILTSQSVLGMETVVKVITARLRQENAFEQLPALTFPERAVPTRRVGATVRRSSLHVVTFHENRGKQSQPFQGNARVAQPEEVPGSLGWRRLKSSTGHMQSSTDNTNQNSTVKSKYLRKPKKSNKQFKSQMVSLSDLKKVFNLSSPEVALDAYKNNSDFKSKIDSLALEVGVNRMGALEQRLGSKLIHHLEPTFDSLPKSEKMAHIMAVLADDLGAAWQLASPLVKPVLSKLATTYGPKLVDWLYSQASQRVKKVKSHGSGQGLVSSSVPLDGVSTVMSMNSSLIYVDSNTVDLAYLAMIFCPEVYKSRCPDTFSAQLCNTMITRTNNPIQTTVDNNYLMYLFTDAACAPGGALNDPFQVTSTSGTGSTCNLGTGAITSPLSGPGVFNSYGAQNIAGFRVTAASIRVIPTLAQYNNQGILTLCYAPEAPNNSVGNVNCAIPSQTALQFPYVHVAAVAGTKEMRQIRVPYDSADLTIDPFATTNATFVTNGGLDVMYLSASGLSPSNVTPNGTSFCTIIYSWCIDFRAGDNLLGLAEQKATPDAPASISAVSSIIKRLPHVTQLNLDEAKELASFIISLPRNDYATVVGSVLNHCNKYSSRPRDVSRSSDAPKEADVMSLSDIS